MGLATAVRRLFGGARERKQLALRPVVRARFDSAETTRNNRRRWQHADNLSADDAASPAVRETLRRRARYEVANNSYAKGIVLTLANDTVGTGPRLQVLTGDDCLNRRIEHDFWEWGRAVALPQKLRTMRMARAQDGEAFGILATNPNLDHQVKLDLRLVEAEQVTSGLCLGKKQQVDGIKLDSFGNPVSYELLRDHPGSCTAFGQKTESVPASSMIHYFRVDRPGQHRGIPEITSALELFGMLRSFTLSVLDAAATAANHAGVAYTDAPAGTEPDDVEPFMEMETERNMFKFLPYGWKLSQLRPEQPATTYAEFKKEILNEIARCLNMPFNVAAGNSSGYNYASGRLDHQTYFKSIRVEQAFMAEVILAPIFNAWILEWSLANGLPRSQPDRAWFWDGMEHVDPAKEAKAQETRLKNHTTTYAAEFARAGKDWETELRQRAKEEDLRRTLKLTASQVSPTKESTDESGAEEGEEASGKD